MAPTRGGLSSAALSVASSSLPLNATLETLQLQVATLQEAAGTALKARLRAETAAARLRPLVEARREALKEEMLGTLKGLGDALLGNFGLSTKNFKAEKDETGAYSVRFVRNPS